MERIVVTLGERSYPITIASGLFNEPASFLPLKSGEQVMLVTNETLAPLYLDKVRGVLEQAGVNVDSVILPDGEQYKSLAVLDTVFYGVVTKAAWSRYYAGGAWRRRSGRSDRLRGGELSARCSFHSSPDDVTVAGRFLRWRQNCGQPSPR